MTRVVGSCVHHRNSLLCPLLLVSAKLHYNGEPFISTALADYFDPKENNPGSLPNFPFSFTVLSPMPSSSTQAAVAPSCSFSDHVEAFARQVIRSAENTARAILRILRCRSIQNAENTKQLCVGFYFHLWIGIDEVKSITIMSSPWQITRRGRNITDWERGVLIGTGSFGSVYRGSNEDGSFFAAKGVSLNEHRHLCHLENEIAILKRLDHQNIIQYYGTEKDGEMLYIFLELVIHGTLEQAYKN
ncbi:mitogen-activated protein kinase kinase kinase [Salix suchowensis]|nr:mitogen-activated protein kinase kinase kinase [Salix suchowensis]